MPKMFKLLDKSKEEKYKRRIELLAAEVADVRAQKKELEDFLKSQHTAQEVWNLNEAVSRLATQRDSWCNRYKQQRDAIQRVIDSLETSPGYSKEQLIHDLSVIKSRWLC